ncbi:single-stranded DNA-binding protein 1 [Microbacterium thalassium]|nr:single-stranded DNA-binding protein 1 [Microbacterium thalassium]
MSDMITFTGRIGTPPTQKVIAGGTTVTTFRVGSTRRRRDAQTGRWNDDGTSWYTVSAYRRLGDFAAASLRTGEPVVVVGRLKIREWENSGAKGVAIDVDADAIGHDLNWGTSTFAKPERAAAESSAQRDPEEEWARPGGDGEEPDAWVTAPIPAAGAAGGSDPSTETPF